MTDTTLTAEAPAVASAPVEAPVAEAPAGEVTTPATAEAPAPVAGAPEAYADFTFPEGFDAAQVNLDDVKAFAKELDLPQDKAQKILDRVIKQRADFETAQSTTRDSVIAKWAEDARADAEIGGDKFEANVAAARQVIENPAFVTPAFKDFLNETGLGNHPEMIRFVGRVQKLVGNDTPLPGGSNPSPGVGLAGLYSHPSSNHS